MNTNEVVLSKKTLNYKKMKEMIELIEATDKIRICSIKVVTNKKDGNKQTEYIEDFHKANDFIEYISDKKKVNEIEINMEEEEKNDSLKLEFNKYERIWQLKYSNETNNIITLICKLKNFFHITIITKLLNKSDLLTIVLGVYVFFVGIQKNDLIPTSILLMASVILLILYWYSFRKKPFKNNKFWEEHKVDIILNIIFYILGFVTPLIFEFINNNIL